MLLLNDPELPHHNWPTSFEFPVYSTLDSQRYLLRHIFSVSTLLRRCSSAALFHRIGLYSKLDIEWVLVRFALDRARNPSLDLKPVILHLSCCFSQYTYSRPMATAVWAPMRLRSPGRTVAGLYSLWWDWQAEVADLFQKAVQIQDLTISFAPPAKSIWLMNSDPSPILSSIGRLANLRRLVIINPSPFSQFAEVLPTLLSLQHLLLGFTAASNDYPSTSLHLPPLLAHLSFQDMQEIILQPGFVPWPRIVGVTGNVKLTSLDLSLPNIPQDSTICSIAGLLYDQRETLRDLSLFFGRGRANQSLAKAFNRLAQQLSDYGKPNTKCAFPELLILRVQRTDDLPLPLHNLESIYTPKMAILHLSGAPVPYPNIRDTDNGARFDNVGQETDDILERWIVCWKEFLMRPNYESLNRIRFDSGQIFDRMGAKAFMKVSEIAKTFGVEVFVWPWNEDRIRAV